MEKSVIYMCSGTKNVLSLPQMNIATQYEKCVFHHSITEQGEAIAFTGNPSHEPNQHMHEYVS